MYIKHNHLTKFKSTAYNIQMIFGKDKFICFSQEINQIVPIISKTIQKILKPSVLKEMDFLQYGDKIYYPNSYSILKRLFVFAETFSAKITPHF